MREKGRAAAATSSYNEAMRFFVKAVATGFALSMGGALFKKVSKKIGLDDDSKSDDPAKKMNDSDLDGELDTELDPGPRAKGARHNGPRHN